MNQPLVSVIIPNYNHERYLDQRIESVLNQTYENFEVIMLDDCSTDNSIEIINKYCNHSKVVKIEINAQNSGSTFRQWEKGMSYASGEFIWIAESDDVADTRFLEKLVSHFEDPEVVLVFTDCKIINEKSEVLHEKNPWIHDPSLDLGTQEKTWQGKNFLNEFQRYRNFVSNASCAVFRKDALEVTLLEKIQEYRFSGDWLFWNTLVLKGKVKFIPEHLCSWRTHDASTRSIADLQKDFSRLKEASRVISETNQLLEKKALLSNYNWVLDWWLSRYSFRNLCKRNYIFPTLPFNRLYVVFYLKLLMRTCKEVFFSVKSKLL